MSLDVRYPVFFFQLEFLVGRQPQYGAPFETLLYRIPPAEIMTPSGRLPIVSFI